MSATPRYWYPGPDGEAADPVTAEEIRRQLASGQLRSTSPLCVEGTQEWRAASTYPEFRGVASATAPRSVAPAPPAAATAPKPAARPGSGPYVPGTRPSLPGPYVSYAQELADLPALLETLRVHDQPPPRQPGARWRLRLLLCGALILLAGVVAAADLHFGFPQSPWSFLIPYVGIGILLVVAAT